MTKQEVERKLQSASGGKILLNLSEIARLTGRGRDSARTMMAGVDYHSSGHTKFYFIGDVAEKIIKGIAQ